MSAISTISATVFAAYLRCPSKAYLLARGERPPGSFFTDTLGRISNAYKAAARERLGSGGAGFASISRLPLPTAPAPDRAVVLVGCLWIVRPRPTLSTSRRVRHQTAKPGETNPVP